MRNSLMMSVVVLAMVAAACGDSSDDTTAATDAAPTSTAAPADSAPPSTDAPQELPTGPSDLTLEDQEGDGSTVLIASVTLPVPGYVVVHGDGGGSPGPVIGHSDLLPAGESADVIILLDEPLTASGTVFPMVHIDADSDGVYEFFPPDDTTDVPGTFADGSVAVAPLVLTVTGGEAAGPSVMISTSALGDIVTDGDGNSLYLFLVDTNGEPSTCYDGCAASWPPLLEPVTPGSGIDASLLGIADRTDGTVQVTYNGWPLYYFSADSAPGDTNGQGVGDVWYLLDPAGLQVP